MFNNLVAYSLMAQHLRERICGLEKNNVTVCRKQIKCYLYEGTTAYFYTAVINLLEQCKQSQRKC